MFVVLHGLAKDFMQIDAPELTQYVHEHKNYMKTPGIYFVPDDYFMPPQGPLTFDEYYNWKMVTFNVGYKTRTFETALLPVSKHDPETGKPIPQIQYADTTNYNKEIFRMPGK